MQTKHVLKIVIPVIFSALAVLSLAIYASLKTHELAEQKETIATRMAASVLERRLVADDYLLNSSERAKSQWVALQNSLEQLVNDKQSLFWTVEERPYLEVIQKSFRDSQAIFDAVTTSFDQTASPEASSVLAAKKARFASQLTIRAQESIAAANQLERINTRNGDRAQARMVWLFSAASLLLTLLLAVCFTIVWRSATLLERRRAENEAILSSIGDAVFAIDTQGRIILFNRACERLTGYSLNEVLHKQYDQVLRFYNEKSGEKVDGFIKEALAGRDGIMAKHTVLRQKDGSVLPIADSAAPIKDGSILGAVIVFRDTTQERQLERMKDEFLSVASHELRTPMGAVRANISMILAGDYGPINKELVEPLTDMKQSTVRLVELVNDLLDVVRIEAGRTKFNLSEFKLQDVIKSTAASLAPLGLEKKIPIKVEAEGDFQVQADADKIKQVLTNLVGNSLKFTDKGKIMITVISSEETAEVDVADSGLGISATDQKKLFTRFNQITTAQDGKPAGTGLGLYISRELIRKIGGELWIKSSEPGKGSVFAFTLPRAGTPTAKQVKEIIDREAELHPDQK